MNSRGWVLCLALLCGMGCTTTIVMRPTEFATGSAVDDRDGRLRDERDAFRVSDRQAVAWAEFENAHGERTARFRWINSDDLVVLDSGPLRVAPDEQLYRVRRVWSVLPIAGGTARYMPGTWRVEVWFDDEKVETLKLKIKE